jgi:CubicO group peptidase (beta-lactamase class C family)
VSSSSGLEARLLAALEPVAEQFRTVGAVLATAAVGGPVTSISLGRSSSTQGPPGPATLFRIGSVTKTFTATALLALAEAGRLSLQDPLCAHLPEAVKIDNPFGRVEDITLGRLLTHRSGLMGEAPLGHWESLQFPDRDQLVDALPDMRVVVAPDSALKYSNLGYALLGEVIARASGQSYRDYLATQVLAPLGMRDTVFTPGSAPLAIGHDAVRSSDSLRDAPHFDLKAMASAGQLYSTAADLLRWGAFHHGDQVGVLSPAGRAAMQHPAYLASDWESGTCLGWGAIRRSGRVVLAHAGGIHGYSAMLMLVPDCRTTLVVLVNDTLGGLEPLALAALDLVLDATPMTPPRPRPVCVVPAATAASVVGWYEADSLPSVLDPVRIHSVDGGLRVQMPTGAGATVEFGVTPSAAPDEFVVDDGRSIGETLRVRRHGGAVSGFALDGFHFTRVGAPHGQQLDPATLTGGTP